MQPRRSFRITLSIGIVLLVLIVAGAVWHVHSDSQKAATSVAATSELAAQYYNCFDQPSRMLSSGTNACSYNGKTYAAPTTFSLAGVRGYSKLPYLADAYVLNTSKQYFNTCEEGGKVAESKIYSLQGSAYILFGLSGTCGTSYQILRNENGAWKPAATSARPVFACDVLKENDVPAQLFTQAGFSAICTGSEGAVETYMTS